MFIEILFKILLFKGAVYIIKNDVILKNLHVFKSLQSFRPPKCRCQVNELPKGTKSFPPTLIPQNTFLIILISRSDKQPDTENNMENRICTQINLVLVSNLVSEFLNETSIFQ